MRNQANGKERTKGFHRQVQLLDRFLKPAQPTQELTGELKRLNRMWATKVAETLVTHYKTKISELMGKIVGLGFTDFTIKNLSLQALGWAKRNFKNKLSLDTIQEYQRIVKSLTAIPPTQQDTGGRSTQEPPEVENDNNRVGNAWDVNQWILKSPRRNSHQRKASPKNTVHNPNPIQINNRFLPLQVLDTEPHTKKTNPAKKLSFSPTKGAVESLFAKIASQTTSKPAQTTSKPAATTPAPSTAAQAVTISSPAPSTSPASTTTTTAAAATTTTTTTTTSKPIGPTSPTSRTPSPRRHTLTNQRSRSASRSSPASSSGSMSPCYQRQTYAAVVLSPQKPTRLTRHQGVKTEWKLPKLTSSTVVVGDSNVSRFRNEAGYKNLQIESYPGAKIDHFKRIFENYHHLEQPKEIIISVGINERDNDNTALVAQKMKDLVKIARSTFKGSEIYLAQIPVSDTLHQTKPKEADNVRKLNENLIRLTGQKVKVLECNVRGGCFFETDGIHWGPRTARSILNRWMQQISLYKAGFRLTLKGTARSTSPN